jgi:hypothetical protein
MILTCFVVEWYNCVVEAGVAIFKKDKNVSETMAELRASYTD